MVRGTGPVVKRVSLAILAASLLSVNCGRSALPIPPPAENQNRPSTEAPASGQQVEVALCVQVVNVPSVDQERMISSVKDAMETSVVKHANWPKYMEAPNKVIRVNGGCPSNPYLLEPGARHPVFNGGGGPKPVARASGYRAFVFVVDDQDITRVFGDSPARVAPQEMMCQGDNCWEVAAALYLGPNDVTDPARIEDGLLKVLGLVQPYGK